MVRKKLATPDFTLQTIWLHQSMIARDGITEGDYAFVFTILSLVSYLSSYLSVSPSESRHGRTAMLLFSLLDPHTRKALGNWLGAALRNPLRLFERSHLQTIMFIQPVDFMANGDQSMCDGCPDITVHDGKLVWSCRMEEVKEFGTFLSTIPVAVPD